MSTDSASSRVSEEHGAAHGAPDVSVYAAAEPEVSARDSTESAMEDEPVAAGPSKSDASRGRRRLKRPPMPSRKSSGTIIVPRDRSTNSDTEITEYPPDDARAMSPRRNSEETTAMANETRQKMQDSAREHQLMLLEIAESIEMVRQSHSQLQRQNEMLQDYIGGLTRSMSQPQRAGKGGKK